MADGARDRAGDEWGVADEAREESTRDAAVRAQALTDPLPNGIPWGRTHEIEWRAARIKWIQEQLNREEDLKREHEQAMQEMESAFALKLQQLQDVRAFVRKCEKSETV